MSELIWIFECCTCKNHLAVSEEILRDRVELTRIVHIFCTIHDNKHPGTGFRFLDERAEVLLAHEIEATVN